MAQIVDCSFELNDFESCPSLPPFLPAFVPPSPLPPFPPYIPPSLSSFIPSFPLLPSFLFPSHLPSPLPTFLPSIPSFLPLFRYSCALSTVTAASDGAIMTPSAEDSTPQNSMQCARRRRRVIMLDWQAEALMVLRARRRLQGRRWLGWTPRPTAESCRAAATSPSLQSTRAPRRGSAACEFCSSSATCSLLEWS